MDLLRKQVQELRELLEQQRQQIDGLRQQVDLLRSNAPPSSPAAPSVPAPAEAAPLPTPPVVPPTAPTAGPPEVPATVPGALPGVPGPAWSPAQPIRIGGTQNYLNLSLDALLAAGWSSASDVEELEQGDHDPRQRGFTLQNLEAIFEGAVDPYFRGLANIVLKIDPEGETTVEAEEAYLETLSLPLNLQLKAGQFFTEFGRINPTHPHTWDFVDAPLVINRLLGPEGLRNPGARLSWLVPTPFYSELFFAVQDSQGETAYSFRNDHDGELFFGRPVDPGRVRSPGDLLFSGRYAASFDLTDSQTLLAGISAAVGPNGAGGQTRLYGADLFWKWKPATQSGGFPFVSWQTEVVVSQFRPDAFPGEPGAEPPLPALPGETLTDYGLYSQVSYGFRKGWVASLRGGMVNRAGTGEYETVIGLDPERDPRWRISPALTWYPTEFSKVRLQYNYDDRDQLGADHSVWMQLEFLLGTHAAHKF